MDYNPLRYMWIATYEDGKAFPQFDPKTGIENHFGDVDLDKLREFGWYPFSVKMAIKILKQSGKVVIPSNNPVFRVKIKDGKQLIAYRHNVIRYAFTDGSIKSRETFYVLGEKGGRIIWINEEGEVVPRKK